jgi:DNA-directed RNA polymerase subunit M/transcription elongation factor TFIIS
MSLSVERRRIRSLFKARYVSNGYKDANAVKAAANLETSLFETLDTEEYGSVVYEILSTKRGVVTYRGTDLWHLPCFKTICLNHEKMKEMLTGAVEVVEGVLECPKCKFKKVMSFELQTRGADEPMTTFATCARKECGYKWRE